MPSATFIEGFQYELSNRAFAMRVAERMVERLEGDVRQPFWQAYLQLERFNAPRYRAAALAWGLQSGPDGWSEIKAWAVASLPRMFMTAALKSAYPRTVAYVDRLQELRQIGPAEARAFLDYMVAQEQLQVEMMRLALDGNYQESVRRVETFVLQYADEQPTDQ